MRDYALMVKILRSCAENSCEGCPIGGAEYTSKDCRKVHNDAADAIEELFAELTTIRKQLPRWISVEDELPKCTNPFRARDVFLVRLRSGCIKTLFYEYDNSDRCRPGMSPLFKEGWAETATPVTHWMPLPKAPEPPTKGVE